MAEQEQNRSEAATPYKIQEAKKRGSVAKSAELNSLVAVIAFLVVFYVCGTQVFQRLLHMSQRIFAKASQVDFELKHFMPWLSGTFTESLYMVVPLFISVAVFMVLTSVVQTGPIFTFFPLKPDADRVNPIAGFKRVFTLKLVLEGVKTIIKLALYGSVLYFAVKRFLPDLAQLMHISPVQYASIVSSQVGSLILKLSCAIAFIAMLDFMYVKWDHANKLKMSRREIREEIKRRDGDPRVRARIRELQRETLKRSKASSRVKDADVLLINPTHLAVAIKYVRDEMRAPKVVAKGAGQLAGLMRDIARKHCVPVVQNKKLARALFLQADFDGPVPEKLYPDVARLLVWIYAMREQRRTVARA